MFFDEFWWEIYLWVDFDFCSFFILINNIFVLNLADFCILDIIEGTTKLPIHMRLGLNSGKELDVDDDDDDLLRERRKKKRRKPIQVLCLACSFIILYYLYINMVMIIIFCGLLWFKYLRLFFRRIFSKRSSFSLLGLYFIYGIFSNEIPDDYINTLFIPNFMKIIFWIILPILNYVWGYKNNTFVFLFICKKCF